jgi:hypothetical protein
VDSASRIDGRDIPQRLLANKPEGFSVFADDASATLWIVGADARGLLYGVGYLLRNLEWGSGRAVAPALDITTSPESPIRGHQLGYRAAANSWDGWTVAQYDQYIRELAFFGVNCIENIPFQDNRPEPHMKISREQMNIELA